jgi:hypothetical protein
MALVLPVHLDHPNHGGLAASHADAATAPQGFGASTPGGSGQPEYRVTSLADSGPGTLRDAISRGNRRVVFDVAGTIQAQSSLQVRGAFITIDGTTAPAPGITLRNPGLNTPVLEIRGSLGAHDVIVRGLRVRGSYTRDSNLETSNDCISVSHSAYRVLIDRVSISGCSDGAIDIIGDPNNAGAPPTQDVTVQWSILADNRKMMLVKYGTTRISLHHNLFVRGLVRLPAISRERLPADTGLTLDMRNNVVLDWGGGSGTSVRYGVTANIVGNVYANPGRGVTDQRQALIVCRGDGVETPESLADCANGAGAARALAWVDGNLSLDGVDVDARRTASTPFAAAAVTTSSACVAGHEVVEHAGAPPRDDFDARHAALVVLPRCGDAPAPSGPAPSPAPEPLPDLATTSVQVAGTVTPEVPFRVDYTLANQGPGAAPASKYTIYLSQDAQRSAGDLVLRDRDSAAHAAGQVSKHAITESVPGSVSPGTYYVLFVADSTGIVRESNESNNVLAVPITVANVPAADLVTTTVALASTVTRNVGFRIDYSLANRGGLAAPASKYTIYLSRDARRSADDLVLRYRDSAPHAPGQVSKHAITEYVPGSVSAGAYYVLFVADSTDLVRESSEANNVRAVPVTVR